MATYPNGAVDVFDPGSSFGFGQDTNTNDPAGYSRGHLPVSFANPALVNAENAMRFSGTGFQANLNCQFFKPPGATKMIVSGYYWSENVAPAGDATLGAFIRFQNTAGKMTTATTTQLTTVPAQFVGPLPANNDWTPVSFVCDITSVPEGRLIAMDIRRNGAAGNDTNNDFSVYSGVFIGFQ